MQFEQGTIIDNRYIIQNAEPLGSGGMSVVHKVKDTNTDEFVALKVMHGDLMAQRKFIKTFEQEAKMLSSFDHPNIVKVRQYKITDDLIYMVMDLVEAGTLRMYLNQLNPSNRQLPFLQAIDIVQQIAKALQYAHDQRIVHRDVKPENILVTVKSADDIDAKLTDFGLLHLMDVESTSTIAQNVGTLPYMAPEQFDQASAITNQTDIYALGIVLYEITVGNLPFRPTTREAAYQCHTNEPVPAPSLTVQDFPPALAAVIMRCLAKKKTDRYQSMNSLISSLNSVKSSLTTGTQDAANFITEDHTNHTPAEPLAPAVLQPLPNDSLVIQHQDKAHEIYKINKTLTIIGRKPTCDVVLEDKRISAEHLRIERRPDRTYWVRNLSKTNVVRVNGDPLPIESEDRQWGFARELTMGPYRLELQKAEISIEEPGSERIRRSTETMAQVLPQAQPVPESAVIPAVRPHNDEQILTEYMHAIPAAMPASRYEASDLSCTLSSEQITINPGHAETVTLTLRNHTDEPQRLELSVRGMPATWAILQQSKLTLTAQGKQDIAITFQPPRAWTSAVGRHTYTVRVRDVAQNTEIKKLTGTLHLLPFYQFALRLHPKRITNQGTARLKIRNDGNVSSDFDVATIAIDDGLQCVASRNYAHLSPGQDTEIPIDLFVTNHARVHGASVFHYRIEVKSPQHEAHQLAGELIAITNLQRSLSAQPEQNRVALESIAAMSSIPFTHPSDEPPMPHMAQPQIATPQEIPTPAPTTAPQRRIQVYRIWAGLQLMVAVLVLIVTGVGALALMVSIAMGNIALSTLVSTLIAFSALAWSIIHLTLSILALRRHDATAMILLTGSFLFAFFVLITLRLLNSF